MEPDKRAIAKPDPMHPSGALMWWIAVVLAGFAGLLMALGAPHVFGQTIKAGEFAEQDLMASKSAMVVDEAQTRLLQQKARESVLPVFKHDRQLDMQILSRLNSKLEQVGKIQQEVGLPMPASLGLTPLEQVYILECPDEVWQRLASEPEAPEARTDPDRSGRALRPAIELTVEQKLARLLAAQQDVRPHKGGARGKPLPPEPADPLATLTQARSAYKQQNGASPVSHEVVRLAASVPTPDWPSVSTTIDKATSRLLQLGPLFPGTATSDWEQTIIEFLPEKWDQKLRLTGALVVASILEPNAVVDTDATRIKADSAATLVKPVTRQVRAGEVIVARGTVISPESVALLRSLGIIHTSNWPMVLSICLSLVAAFALVGSFLYTYEQKHLFSPASIGLMCTVSVVTCGIGAFAGLDYPQFVPVPAAALVLTIFFGTRVAAILTLLILVFLGVDNLIGMHHLVALGTASLAAIGANITQRRQLMVRGFLIGVLQMAGYLAAVVVTQSGGSAASLGGALALHFLGGLSSCIVAVGSLPFLENIFGMVTPFRLAELTDATQPLLRRLEDNAPGTYQHSLAVANLAEAGARAIGADVNLVRAGALYHDIGKMVRPKYFIENQLGDRNPHDAISPEESRDRVLAHVTDGVALAHKYDLPKVVQDFIPQHQGTTLMAYFYHKACLRDGLENVDPSFYRYPGPKPQSREASIVMLADVSEAVTHSLRDPTQEEIEQAMSTVFKARWDDGQFSQANLTENELERIKKAFARVWRTLHHERLKYPSTTTGRMAVPPEHPAKPSTVGPSPS